MHKHRASSHRRLWLRRALTLLACGPLAACGFRLRGAATFPFQSVHAPFAQHSQLGQELRRSLQASGVRVITDPRDAAVAQTTLDVLMDEREKVVVGVSASGQVREFQLRIRLSFRLRDAAGKVIIPQTLLVQQRDISFNESGALAKEAEEALMYRAMQSDIVQQLQRHLSSVKLD